MSISGLCSLTFRVGVIEKNVFIASSCSDISLNRGKEAASALPGIDMRVWISYIEAELAIGEFDEAKKVFVIVKNLR